jgi:hypothetical protein
VVRISRQRCPPYQAVKKGFLLSSFPKERTASSIHESATLLRPAFLSRNFAPRTFCRRCVKSPGCEWQIIYQTAATRIRPGVTIPASAHVTVTFHQSSFRFHRRASGKTGALRRRDLKYLFSQLTNTTKTGKEGTKVIGRQK